MNRKGSSVTSGAEAIPRHAEITQPDVEGLAKLDTMVPSTPHPVSPLPLPEGNAALSMRFMSSPKCTHRDNK